MTMKSRLRIALIAAAFIAFVGTANLAVASCEYTSAGCAGPSVGTVLERWRQDQYYESLRRDEREKQRQLIESDRINKARKVPGPLIVTAPKHGPGELPPR